MGVGVLHDNRIGLGARRPGRPGEAGKCVAAILRVLERNIAAIGEGGRRDAKVGAILGREFLQRIGPRGRGRGLGEDGAVANEKKPAPIQKLSWRSISRDFAATVTAKTQARLGPDFLPREAKQAGEDSASGLA